MTQGMLAALDAQSQAAIAEADGAFLVARSACIVAMLQHKLPAEVLASAAVVVVFPDLLSRTPGTGELPGFFVECNNGDPARIHVVHLEGAGLESFRLPGSLILIATATASGRAMLAGGKLGVSIPVVPGPLRQGALPVANCVFGWFFCAGYLCAAIVADAAVRFDHTPSDRTVSSLRNALSTAVFGAQRYVADTIS